MGIYVKFLLCIVFITNTVGYSACPSVLDSPTLRATRDENGACVAYSFSALEECLKDMVEDLNEVIDGLFGDTSRIVKKGFILSDSKTGTIRYDLNTGSAVFVDDYVFVQLTTHTGSTIHGTLHFCADRFGAYEYISPPSSGKDFTFIKWGRYKSFTKIDFPPKWFPPRWRICERLIECHPCRIFQFGEEYESWKNGLPPPIEIKVKIGKILACYDGVGKPTFEKNILEKKKER